MTEPDRDERTFFVSRTGADADLATWIAGCIASVEGWAVHIQDWDFTPAQNWGHQMHQLVEAADHIVPVLSPDYFASGYGEAEWLAGFVRDPVGDGRRVIPVRIRECTLVGLFRGLKHIDLVGIPREEEARARQALIDGITAAVNGSWPRVAGPFPGTSADGDGASSGPLAALPPSGRPAHRKLYGVAERNPDFVGRAEDLLALGRTLATSDVSLTTSAAIEALAGVGKTELATMLAHALADGGWFGGGIYWLPAEDPDLTPAWAALAVGLGLDGTAEDQRNALFRRIAGATEPVLIVLDNVDRWPLPPEAVLPASDHRLLVTTRVRGLGGRSFQHHDLGLLSAEESRDLLVGLAGEGLASQPGLEALVERLDGHALAVELAGAVLAEAAGELTPADYLELLDQGASPTGDTRHGDTVEGVLSLLFERLSPDEQLAWMTVARLEPEWISRELLDACSVDAEARKALRRLHLVETGDDGCKMHRLVGEFGRRCGDEEQRDQADEAHVSGLMARARKMDISLGHQIYLPDRAHFDRAASDRPASWGARDNGYFLDRLGAASHSAGLLVQARAFVERALEVGIASLGEGDPLIATRQSNLAGVLQSLGDLQGARQLLEQSLASDLATRGEGHPSVAIRRSNLADVLRNLGELQGARALLEKALESGIASLGDDHPSVAIRRSILGLVLMEQGDLEGARLLLEKALQSTLASLGEAHPAVSTRRNNLASVLIRQGDLAGAKVLLKQALESDLAILGEHHPAVATCRNNLASVLRNQGDLVGARELLEQALRCDLLLLGDGHPSVANRRGNLAVVKWGLGDLKGAQALLRRALDSDLASFGPGHPFVARRMANLAYALRELGDTVEAQTMAVEALRVARLQPEGTENRTYVERMCSWADP